MLSSTEKSLFLILDHMQERITRGKVKKSRRRKTNFRNGTVLEMEPYLGKLQRFSWQSMPFKENAR